ncbi:putative RNA-directed DNA polymerase from transposon X-element [Penicillium digitatum]|uniref:Putative RNA-directed DNA polymerase from transposon X-element n=1 Tax=Penicillium digitatum TaxID=36651 RepID=A0A7T7BM80_PENDI|nr:putative RNA-directed DNA polymerase from transposon X-element [Penicillium digitatum]
MQTTTQVLDFLKGIQELTADIIKNPIGQEWRQQFEQLRQETSQIKQDIHAVRIASSNPIAAGSNRIRSYVDAIKSAPPLTHFLSTHGSASTNPATPSDLLQDRQIIVKLGDSDGIKLFRTRTPAEITKLAEKARVKAAKATDGLAVASAKFVAARQLKSGDISLSLRTAKEAEIMRCHRLAWVKHLWKGSEVRLPSWGVVIHDVNVRSLGINSAAEIKDRKQGITKQLLTENLFHWGADAEITQISWLVLPEGKKSGSLIVEFLSPHTANKSIDTGTLWDSEVLTTVVNTFLATKAQSTQPGDDIITSNHKKQGPDQTRPAIYC